MAVYLGSSAVSVYAGGIAVPAADGIGYDNTASGLAATNVQAAIDEVAVSMPSLNVTDDGNGNLTIVLGG